MHLAQRCCCTLPCSPFTSRIIVFVLVLHFPQYNAITFILSFLAFFPACAYHLGHGRYRRPKTFSIDGDARIVDTIRQILVGQVNAIEHFLDGFPRKDFASDFRFLRQVFSPFNFTLKQA